MLLIARIAWLFGEHEASLPLLAPPLFLILPVRREKLQKSTILLWDREKCPEIVTLTVKSWELRGSSEDIAVKELVLVVLAPVL